MGARARRLWYRKRDADGAGSTAAYISKFSILTPISPVALVAPPSVWCVERQCPFPTCMFSKIEKLGFTVHLNCTGATPASKREQWNEVIVALFSPHHFNFCPHQDKSHTAAVSSAGKTAKRNV